MDLRPAPGGASGQDQRSVLVSDAARFIRPEVVEIIAYARSFVDFGARDGRTPYGSRAGVVLVRCT